ncbi:undecaprenyl-diphosphatase BcrC [Oxobacter pfennigii]|uniref:Undecaprenyl-diphosphatase BcrC n=1 Tax=Oxobacter pfennigii TaxID=36849 RepID=A0A0P9ACR7_9CLOT|nr:phosphatase PAP2 family protein [Oxobacter pfennigii]KPU42885.1 undecaprenyl-diphosphatase BcrC [Oxobacter pfennigii]
MEYLLEMLKWIQSIRNPVLDHAFTFITVLGEDYFAIAVLCLILWCVNKKSGYAIGFAYLTSWIFNFSLKEAFKLPRPFILDRGIIPIRPETATGYSFPSGHTQGISALSAAIGTAFRKKWLYAAGSTLVIFMAMSRMYLGVHTLLDVAVGAVAGITWAFVANLIFSYSDRANRKVLLLFMFIPMALGMVFIQDNDYYKIAGTFTSFVIGYLLDCRYIHYEAKSSAWQQAAKFIIGMAVLISIKGLVKEVLGENLASNYLRYFLIGFWITVAAPLLFKKMFGAKFFDTNHQLNIQG